MGTGSDTEMILSRVEWEEKKKKELSGALGDLEVLTLRHLGTGEVLRSLIGIPTLSHVVLFIKPF